ncbi:unnamed protein product, partial [Rotaria sordida]
MTNVKFLKCDIYQHLCEDLKTSPNNQILIQTITFLPGIKKNNVSSNVIQDDYVPSIKELTEKFNYTIGIALTLLPNREDMIRIRSLKDYFNEFSHRKYPDLLSTIDHADAFGVYYASQSSAMSESIQQITAQAERDKQQKIQEVKNAKE